jgi:tRNA-dihydrouridine synthase C
MEGLADDVLREVLTRVEGYDHAVTEFVRVSGSVLPARAFTRISPELRAGSATSSGTPVRVQLLGSDPACMADNAAQLARLNPAGIDLNFGCPAPTVNRHRGGAALLDEPELLHAIACAVRRRCRRTSPSPPRCAWAWPTPARPSTAPGLWPMAASSAWWCMPAPRTTATARRPWEWVGRIADVVACRWWPTARCGRGRLAALPAVSGPPT